MGEAKFVRNINSTGKKNTMIRKVETDFSEFTYSFTEWMFLFEFAKVLSEHRTDIKNGTDLENLGFRLTDGERRRESSLHPRGTRNKYWWSACTRQELER